MTTTTDREYHPDLPDHPLAWMGARVALSTGHGAREHYRFATVTRFTKTQVILTEDKILNGKQMENRFSVKNLDRDTTRKWPTYWKHASDSWGASTVMCATNDPQVIASRMRAGVSTTRNHVDNLLDVHRRHRGGFKIPVEEYRKALTAALASLAAAKTEFERLADMLPADTEEI